MWLKVRHYCILCCDTVFFSLGIYPPYYLRPKSLTRKVLSTEKIVKIREYTEADLAALQRMHARQGFQYPFPNLRDPLFVSKLVLEDDDGRPVMASLARLTCEMYLLVDRDGNEETRGSTCTPENQRCGNGAHKRYAQLLALHDAGQRDLMERGLHDAHAWLPPPIAKRFGRRLAALGWMRDDAWTPYCKRFDSE